MTKIFKQLGRHWAALRRHWDGTACSAGPTAL